MKARIARSVAVAAVLSTILAACTRSRSTGNPGGPNAAPTPVVPEAPTPPDEVTEVVYDGGLKNDWHDWGWAPRETNGPGPAKVKFAHWGGWILAKPSLKNPAFGALVMRVKTPKGEGEFLELRVESATGTTFPRIKVGGEHRVHLDGEWDEIRMPLSQLNPDELPFDRIIIRAFREVQGDDWTFLDRIGFTKGELHDAAARLTQAGNPSGGNAKPVAVSIACGGRATKISPQIYGIAYHFMNDKQEQQWQMGATIRRWGGNPTSRYNWQIHAWNLDSDWFFENVSVAPYTQFLADDASHGMMSALTVPMIGWVAKDTTSVGFPVSAVGPQERTDQWRPDAGNGKTKDGKEMKSGPPSRTSVPASPDFVKQWIAAIRKGDAGTGKRSVHQYILDNEPAIWHSTHRDVRPEPLGYDELVEKTIQYGTAVRQADPDAVIAGPAEWGWLGYLYSGKDTANNWAKADRKAHGDVPLIEYYLAKLRDHEQKTGVRVLDVVDLHYYPQSENVHGGGEGGGDEKTNALRIRSTRSLWDPDYEDESWIKEKIRLLPRMKEWIQRNYPGRGMSIGEWNFGGEQNMSGALASAEVLGRFGQFGVTSAFYWTFPRPESPTLSAFLAYRNFDGKGGRFLDWSLPVTETPLGKVKPDEPLVSMFASRDEDGKHIVAVILNMSPDVAASAKVDVSSCGTLVSRQSFATTRGVRGILPGGTIQGPAPTIEQFLPPYSITILDIRLAGAMSGSIEK